MSRIANPNSVRQRAFKMLSDLKTVKRDVAIRLLMTHFKIGVSYAETLHGAYRTMCKKDGSMLKVYTVLDVKDGKAVKPFMKVKNTFNVKETDAQDPIAATAKYVANLNAKIENAQKLF